VELIAFWHFVLRIRFAAHDGEARKPWRQEVDRGLVIPTGYSFNLDGTAIYLYHGRGVHCPGDETPADLSHQLTLLACCC
jgi:hypothetical protein